MTASVISYTRDGEPTRPGHDVAWFTDIGLQHGANLYTSAAGR